MKKRAQFQLSFGMIFSIFLIIATIGIAVYAILHFIQINDMTICVEFYENLKQKVDTAWNADMVKTNFSNRVPSKTQFVCFGNVSLTAPKNKDREILSEIKSFYRGKNNLFFYPAGSCGEQFSFNVPHIKTDNFFCIENKKGKVTVEISKNIEDALVKLK